MTDYKHVHTPLLPGQVRPQLDEQAIASVLNGLSKVCHQEMVASGWWHDEHGNHLKRNVPEILCLIHSEISEAMEGIRKGLMDDKVPSRLMVEVELADALIRIFDLAGAAGLDLGGALVDKTNFNRDRADHKMENRLKEGGKKF